MPVDLAQRRREHVALLDSELPRIVDGLKAMGASLIVLFGSYARGRRDLLTDLDLLVVMESDQPFIERLGHVYEQIRPRISSDILIYTAGEFEDVKKRSFIRHALATGQVLYERP